MPQIMLTRIFQVYSFQHLSLKGRTYDKSIEPVFLLLPLPNHPFPTKKGNLLADLNISQK